MKKSVSPARAVIINMLRTGIAVVVSTYAAYGDFIANIKEFLGEAFGDIDMHDNSAKIKKTNDLNRGEFFLSTQTLSQWAAPVSPERPYKYNDPIYLTPQETEAFSHKMAHALGVNKNDVTLKPKHFPIQEDTLQTYDLYVRVPNTVRDRYFICFLKQCQSLSALELLREYKTPPPHSEKAKTNDVGNADNSVSEPESTHPPTNHVAKHHNRTSNKTDRER